MLNHANAIATLCTNRYKCMKKTGKPGDTEWTVLAGIILKDADEKLTLVSIATGTKCLGAKELSNFNLYEIGDRLSDSHAEILARRAFLRYLYDQIDLLLCNGNSKIFVINTNQRIEIKPGLSFHFYCSQTPCGDCSIILMNENETRDTNSTRKKSKKDDDCIENISILSKSYEITTDIHRTGAKCLSTESKRDAYLPGIDYHVTGALRTKPGRGDPTLSLSCSDKIAKWNAVGIQGSFLSLFIPILRLETIVIGGECPFSRDSLERGLYKRFGIDIAGPTIFQSTVSFSDRKSSVRINPCPSSIVWCDVRHRDTEIAVEGRKQGATKNKKISGLLVSKKGLFKSFLKTVDRYPSFKSLPRHPKKINYYHCKQWCILYQKRWKDLKKTIFSTWPDKPMKLQNFTI